MYFDLISRQRLGGWRPFANYLYAIAEWHLDRVAEPLEITARRLRGGYQHSEDFLAHLRETLYAGLQSDGSIPIRLPNAADLCSANGTLGAIRALCLATTMQKGVASVITYNYDNLLEHAVGAGETFANLGRQRGKAIDLQPVWRDREIGASVCPIYHVHGYVPATGEGSSAGQILFTEDQYNLAAADPYAWQNLVQLSSFSGSTGLMVGLSLSDRNMRRLLDAVMRTPRRSENFALLKRPVWPTPTKNAVDEIDQKARAYIDRFERSGAKSQAMMGGVGHMPSGVKARGPQFGGKGPRYELEIRAILEQVESIDIEQQSAVLSQLGVCPIWYDDHSEIPQILRQISAGK